MSTFSRIAVFKYKKKTSRIINNTRYLRTVYIPTQYFEVRYGTYCNNAVPVPVTRRVIYLYSVRKKARIIFDAAEIIVQSNI